MAFLYKSNYSFVDITFWFLVVVELRIVANNPCYFIKNLNKARNY